MRKFILMLFILLPSMIVHAYSNQFFDIKMPSDYKNILEKDGVYQWVNKDADTNYVISVRLKANDRDILKYNDQETKEYVTGVIKTLENQYNTTYEQEVNVSLIYYGKEKMGKYNAMLIETKIPNFLDLGEDMEQHMYIIESKNFLYSFVYSTATETFDEKELTDVIKSFEINDQRLEPWFITVLKNVAIAMIFIITGFILGIILMRYLMHMNRRKTHEKE